ncbi:MAG: hypothetical protein JSW06_03470 [Thermoplasmatales archaeon]|nr:MAG: hypothetical protein JSW06_03470 [Thermoplasmatales archaeon]
MVDRIKLMDDKTFERYIAYIIESAQKDNKLNGINPDRIREVFYLLRYSDTSIPLIDVDGDFKYASVTVGPPSACCHLGITFDYGIKGFLDCILILLLLPFILIIEILCAIAPPRPGTWILCPSQPTI